MHVVVAGAGIIGCAVAYELASRGASVRIIDPRGYGRGATKASAGMLAPYIEGHSPQLLALGVSSLNHYDRFIARITADSARAVEYRRPGTLQVAVTEDEASELADRARHLTDARVDHLFVSAGELRKVEPALSADARAALRIPQHGYVGVSSLMSGLAAASERRGVTITVARVEAFGKKGDSVAVTTSEGVVECDAAVVAAGSWSGRIDSGSALPAPVHPIRGQIVQLHASPAPLAHVVWGSGCYLVPWQDGTVLVGATMEDVGFDERTTDVAVRNLRESGRKLVPALGAATFVDARAGLRPATSDELPIIGPSSTTRGVFYATGHYRNGVLLAPLTASLVTDLVLGTGAGAELDLVRPSRFGL